MGDTDRIFGPSERDLSGVRLVDLQIFRKGMCRGHLAKSKRSRGDEVKDQPDQVMLAVDRRGGFRALTVRALLAPYGG